MSTLIGPDKKVVHHSVLLAAIVLSAATAMTLLVPFEMLLTRFISAHRVDWFVEMMGDSLFELEQPGGGDLIVFFLTSCVLLYLASSLIDSDCSRSRILKGLQRVLLARPGYCDALRRHRLRLEFLLVSSFGCAVLMVKTLQWTMARPRPKRVLFGGEPFSDWYQFGPYFLDGGLYRGSFPSGHAALAVTLLGLAYVFIYTVPERRERRGGVLLLLAALLIAVAMAVARVMSLAHWPTDVMFSFFAGWLLIHCLFFYGFRVVAWQNSSYSYRGQVQHPPPWRAFRICWYLSLLCLALAAMVLGVRHFLYDRWQWLLLCSVAALPLFGYALKKIGVEGLFRR